MSAIHNNRWLIIAFIIGSFTFLAIYLTVAIVDCQNNLNQTDEYIYNATCYCKNNVGNSQVLGALILQDTDWYRNTVDNGVIMVTFPAVMSYPNTSYFSMTFIGPQFYLQYYYPVEWNYLVVHNKTIDLFHVYDPFNFTTQTLINVETPLGAVPYEGCYIKMNSNMVWTIMFPNATGCVKVYQEVIGDKPILTQINMGYSNNPTYQSYCQLSYCEVNYCSSSQYLQIFLIGASIVTGYFSFLRLVSYLLRKIKKLNAGRQEFVV
jgi:hypothetical protein